MNRRFRTALQAGLAAAALAAAASFLAAAASPSGREGRWNDTDLLGWVAGLGGPESRYDGLASVQAFERLQQSIEEVKQMVLHDARSEREAIEGLRMILKHLAVATQDSIHGDLMNPLMAKRDPRIRDIGAYNPDAEYDQALIDGRYDYKLTGNLGGVPYVSITVNGSGGARGSRALAYLDDAAIRKHAAADGRFTLWLTEEKPSEPGAWIRLPDDANGVVIRQYVTDRDRQPLASFAIEAVGDPLPDVERISDGEMATRLARTAGYLLVSSTWHRTLLPEMRERPNQFFASSGTSIGASAANAESYYQMAYYEVEDNEVLVIDFEPPRTKFWNLTAASIWHESQRYLLDPVSLTSDEVARREDGTVRFVVSRGDPGHPNWIKTFGHDRGFLILRMVGVETHPLPAVRRVAAGELRELESSLPVPGAAHGR
jgi:hypothetical protein